MSYYNNTPLLHRSFGYAETKGPQFLLKYECLQPSGSFKSRGIGHLIHCKIQEEKERGSDVSVFSSSGGNAGLAAATACNALRVNCTVVVPTTTKYHMIKKIERAGARVIVYGEHWGISDHYLRESVIGKLPPNSKALYVHPFDDPLIWEGHSTMVDEIVEQLRLRDSSLSDVKGIICSVGGGGLYNGVITGLERHGIAEDIPIIAVETDGADTFSKSLSAGKPVELEMITSIASSLGSPYIAQDSFDKAIRYRSKSFVLSDLEAVNTCARFLDDSNILVEPACAASLSLCYRPETLNNILNCQLTEKDIIIVIVCGGSAITRKDLEKLLQELNSAL